MTPGPLLPSLAPDALLAKSRLYVRRALASKSEGDLDEYQLWASLALELLGKSALAQIHPSLIVDPTHFQSLFAASGINISTDVKTIAAHTLFERLKHLDPSFDEKAKNFCIAISLRRNAELHSGETPFRSMRLDSWESQYWHVVSVVLRATELSLDDWLGALLAETPKAIVEQAAEVKRQATQGRIERARDEFLGKSKTERERALSDASNRQAYHYRNLFSFVSDREWSVDCPACAGKAYLAGIQIEETVGDPYSDEDGAWESVETTYSAEEFRCPVCNLSLGSVEEIEASGLELQHIETEEREMEYEPDYGND